MVMTRRERQRVANLEEIKHLARQHMRAEGTAALSLRAIAREMGLTVTALYRYYPSRDDLITALILDGFNAQADTLEAVVRDAGPDALSSAQGCRATLRDALLTYRAWALQHPVDFQLLYGNPIPGYHAPADLTRPAAARNFSVIVGILIAAQQGGWLRPSPAYTDLPAPVRQHLMHSVPGVPAQVSYIATVGWSRIHGMITLELFEHTPPVVGDADAFYRHEVDTLIQELGLATTP